MTRDKMLRGAERTLNAGTWAITLGAVLFSVLTVTPLVQGVTPKGWQWTAPILPLVVDAAVVIVIRLDSTVSRLGGDAKGRWISWPAVLRWLTGLFTLALNIGNSALKGDMVGVAVHAVAPALLIVTAEAGLAYRRAIAKALDRIAGEQREEAERQRVHKQAERERERAEREQREQAERERIHEQRQQAEREAREHAAKSEREQRDHEAQMLREQREYEANQRREEADRAERQRERERQEREAKERREREERERREREEQERTKREQTEREQREKAAREQAERIARERRERQAVNTTVNTAVNTRTRAAVNTPAKTPVNTDRMPEEEARQVVMNTPGASVRQLVDATGWSIGWVSKVRRETGGTADTEETAVV